MLKQRQFEFSPRHWQNGVGQRLATDLDQIVTFWGFADQVEVKSYPDQETFLIRIFRLDLQGEVISKITDRKGIEFFRIEISYPSQFSMSVERCGESQKAFVNCVSERELKQRAKLILEDTLFRYWSNLDS